MMFGDERFDQDIVWAQVEGLPVYGMAVPTVVGLRIVLDILGASEGKPDQSFRPSFRKLSRPVLQVFTKPQCPCEPTKRSVSGLWVASSTFIKCCP